MLCKSLQTYWIILWSRNLKVMIVLWLGWVRRYRDFFYNIIKNSCTASSNSNVGLPTYRWCHNSREKNLPVCLIGNKQDLVSSSLFSVSNESKYDSGKTWPLNETDVLYDVPFFPTWSKCHDTFHFFQLEISDNIVSKRVSSGRKSN